MDWTKYILRGMFDEHINDSITGCWLDRGTRV